MHGLLCKPHARPLEQLPSRLLLLLQPQPRGIRVLLRASVPVARPARRSGRRRREPGVPCPVRRRTFALSGRGLRVLLPRSRAFPRCPSAHVHVRRSARCRFGRTAALVRIGRGTLLDQARRSSARARCRAGEHGLGETSGACGDGRDASDPGNRGADARGAAAHRRCGRPGNQPVGIRLPHVELGGVRGTGPRPSQPSLPRGLRLRVRGLACRGRQRGAVPSAHAVGA